MYDISHILQEDLIDGLIYSRIKNPHQILNRILKQNEITLIDLVISLLEYKSLDAEWYLEVFYDDQVIEYLGALLGFAILFNQDRIGDISLL